jgi:hypothetical protein
MASESKSLIGKIYGLQAMGPTEAKDHVKYLLWQDRYTCHPAKYDVSLQIVLLL